VNCSIGQLAGSREHLKMAQQYFQLVGRPYAPNTFGVCQVSELVNTDTFPRSTTGRQLGQRVRHHPRAAVHGVVLLLAAAGD
jgi:hypothetical protein